MTNKEKFIEIMNQTFNAGFTQENFAPAKNGSCPVASSAGICSPCGFYKDRACLSYTCDGCQKWWDKEYKEMTQNGD